MKKDFVVYCSTSNNVKFFFTDSFMNLSLDKKYAKVYGGRSEKEEKSQLEICRTNFEFVFKNAGKFPHSISCATGEHWKGAKFEDITLHIEYVDPDMERAPRHYVFISLK